MSELFSRHMKYVKCAYLWVTIIIIFFIKFRGITNWWRWIKFTEVDSRRRKYCEPLPEKRPEESWKYRERPLPWSTFETSSPSVTLRNKASGCVHSPLEYTHSNGFCVAHLLTFVSNGKPKPRPRLNSHIIRLHNSYVKVLWLVVRLQLQSSHLQQKIPQTLAASPTVPTFPPRATQNHPTHNCCGKKCPLFDRGRSSKVLQHDKDNLLGCFVLARGGHPRVHTCSHTDGCSRDAFGHVTFSVSPFSSATPVLLAWWQQLPPFCSAPFTSRHDQACRLGPGNGRYFFQSNIVVAFCGRRRRRPRKVQECLLTRAPSTRLSSPWWEPPRPWSSAVTSRLLHLTLRPLAGAIHTQTDIYGNYVCVLMRSDVYERRSRRKRPMRGEESAAACSHLSRDDEGEVVVVEGKRGMVVAAAALSTSVRWAAAAAFLEAKDKASQEASRITAPQKKKRKNSALFLYCGCQWRRAITEMAAALVRPCRFPFYLFI